MKTTRPESWWKESEMTIHSRIRGVTAKSARQNHAETSPGRLTAVDIPSEAPSISILDENNPNALINLLPDDFAERLRNIPREYFSMREEELKELADPDDILNKLKLRFWDEWQVSILSGMYLKIPISAVYYGVCTEEYFVERVFFNPAGLAWMVTPPTDYVVTMRDVLHQGIARLKEIIQLPLMVKVPVKCGSELARDDEGNILYDTKIERGVISEIRQIVTLLSDRLHGAVVQRLNIEQKSLSLNVSEGTSRLLAGEVLEIEDSEMDALEKQLEKINGVLKPVEEVLEKEEEAKREKAAEMEKAAGVVE